jgi:hypothetical protein
MPFEASLAVDLHFVGFDRTIELISAHCQRIRDVKEKLSPPALFAAARLDGSRIISHL